MAVKPPQTPKKEHHHPTEAKDLLSNLTVLNVIGLWSAIGISITAAASLDCKNPIKRNRRRHRNLMISLCPQPALGVGIVHAKQKIWRDNHLVGGCGRAECVNAIEIRISGFLVLFCSAAESVHHRAPEKNWIGFQLRLDRKIIVNVHSE